MECQRGIISKPHWYVIQTKPRQETIAETNLLRQSYEIYFPLIKESRRRRGKWTDLVQPLFPGYLFVRLDLSFDNVAPIRSTYGVINLVKFGELVSPISDHVIQGLQESADPITGLHYPHKSLFNKGDEVTVITGPLSGLSGVFQATTGKERVAVLLKMLGRMNTVVLNEDSVAPSHSIGYL